MRKLGTKVAALLLAGAMMIAPVTVYAADTEVTDPETATGTIQGSGDVEAIVDKDIFAVVLPTVADHASTFNFILDPQEVIKSTNNAAYPGATFNDHTGVYFNSATDTYGKDSAVLTATNKSSYDVDITLSATASALSDSTKGYTIPLTSDDTFAGDTTTSLYLALVSGGQTEPLTSKGATITSKIAALPDAYEIAYDNASNEYKYQLKASATGFETSTFNMTGACNKNADWTIAKDATPTVDVTWDVSRHFVAPKSDGTVDVVIPYTGAKPANGSIELTKPDGETWTPGASAYGENIIVTDKSITFIASWLNSQKNNASRGIGTYSFILNGKQYSFELVDTLTPPVPVSDGTVDIVIPYTGAKPADGGIEFTMPNGATWTPGASAYGTNIVVTDDSITFTASWLDSQKNNDSRGLGVYSFILNGEQYSFELVDTLTPPIPTSDGTTDIVISYTGAKPADGSIEFTMPNGTTWTPGASAYGTNIVVADDSITFTASWLNSQKNNEARGTGTYSFTLNNVSYSFILQ